MTKYEAGYLQALRDVQEAVRTFSSETTSSDGKLELLTVLVLLDKLIDLTETSCGGEIADKHANENVEARDD